MKEIYLPKPYLKRRYYNLKQVQQHNTANDAWITYFHRIYDITPLIQQNIHSKLVEPLIQSAGTDITHWFNDATQQPRTFINVKTGRINFYCPKGRYLHIPSIEPNIQEKEIIPEKPQLNFISWWKDQKCFIGMLTKKSRKIKIINTLSNTEDIVLVPQEEKINQILVRYQKLNFHASSYTWKRKGVNLDMDKTLTENGIIDQTEQYQELEIPQTEWYIPSIHIYFDDDLTVK